MDFGPRVSWAIGPDICLGALMVGLPFLLGPLRRDILFLSSDIMKKPD
jgi:hypothetical protein